MVSVRVMDDNNHPLRQETSLVEEDVFGSPWGKRTMVSRTEGIGKEQVSRGPTLGTHRDLPYTTGGGLDS